MTFHDKSNTKTNSYILSADDSDNWRRKRQSMDPPLRNNQNYNYQNHTGNYRNTNKYLNSQRQYRSFNGNTNVKSTVDLVPPPRREVPAKNAENLNKRTEADQAGNWRSTAAPLPSLPQKLSFCHPDDRNGANKREYFKHFLSMSQMEKEIKDGLLYQGIMRLSRNREDAYVTSDDLDADIYIGGMASRNRSLQGDLVAVRLLDIDRIWDLKKERDARKRQERSEEINDVSTEKSNVQEDDKENNEEQYKPKYCGEVVGILLHPPDISYSGFITVNRFSDTSNVSLGENHKILNKPQIAWFRPTDKRVPLLKLKNEDVPPDLIENNEYYRTHLFSAAIRRWQITDTNPIGRIIKKIGPVGDLFAERESIISDNNVIATSFSSAALRNLPELPWFIPKQEFKHRRDLRSKRVFSIDPVAAKDLDDALHINELEGDFFEVGVHIADVSYFLKKGSVLDNEAYGRGTSTYLVDSVIPMLPPILSEELCSLNPGVDRLAFSVVWKMDPFGIPVDTWFGKTIIRSCAKLAYEDAQCVIDGKGLPDSVTVYDGHSHAALSSDILSLNSIALQKRQKRYADGSLSLNSVKLNFELNENGEPVSMKRFEAKDANRLIEEFMLCANISVAKKITASFPDEALLRRHEDPLERRLSKFLELTDTLGLDFDGYNAGALQESFDKVKNKDVKDVLLILAIRCMQRAKYFCAGVGDISKYGHYALNEPLYTHFTSPIRRYADVIVHRMLEATLNEKEDCGYNKKVIQKITFTCNNKKDGAKSAQDASINLYLARYLSDLNISRGPIYTKADVITVTNEVYEVYVPEFGLEKKFHISDLPVEQYFFDKRTYTLDIFWKHGVPVTLHNEEQIYARERIRKDDYSDEEIDDEDEQELSKGLDDLVLEPKLVQKINDDSELISPVILEANTGLQRLKMFSTIDVRIQVNRDRSPPIINIYPVNPFSGEKIVEYYG